MTTDTSFTPVSLAEIRSATQRAGSLVRRTPLVEAPDTLVAVGGSRPGRLLLKCESLQVGGAFKIRGAYNLMTRLDGADGARGVITYSSGNHAQAVALAARALGFPAVVVMPTTAPRVKIDAARRYGAEVVFEGTSSAERQIRAETEAARRGLTIVPPFDDPLIIAGQGTTGLEILEQCPTVETIVVPIGGGGLLSGVAAAVKQMRPSVRLIGVEPAGAARMTASLAAGHPVTLERVRSIADGLLCVRPGDLTFAHTQGLVDAVVTVDDTAIAEAVLWLFQATKLVVEPSGAATVAAIRTGAILGAEDRAAGSAGPVVALVSGGNVAPDTVAEIAKRAPPAAGGATT